MDVANSRLIVGDDETRPDKSCVHALSTICEERLQAAPFSHL